jgi:CRP-like cAMP-binding protein
LSEPDRASGLRSHATPVRARRRQRLALANGSAEAVYVVRTGLLGLEAAPPDKHRHVLTLLYPGDIVRNASVPRLASVTLGALSPSETWRLQEAAFAQLLAADAALAAHVQRQLAEQHARATLHATIVGTLSGEQRFASLLLELGLRFGEASPGGVTFEMPLSRADVADYLALNADTLSRITSRLRTRGLLVQAQRGRIVLPDWEGLCALSPVAGALGAQQQAASAS